MKGNTVTERQLPRKTKYPWTEWTDGQKHVAKRGVDFEVPAYSFVANIHQRARLIDMRAETSTNEDEVTFIFIRPE